MAIIRKNMISSRQNAKAVLFAIAFTVIASPSTFVSAADCSQVSCVSGDTSAFGNADLANTGSTACAGLTYAPECNATCNNNGAGSDAPFACKPAATPPAAKTNTGGSCDSFNCYAQGQCPSGTAPSSSCGGTCPPPGGLTQLTTYCAPSNSTFASNTGGDYAGSSAAGSGITFPTNTGLPDPQGGVLQILGNFFGWLLAIFGFLSIGAFVISGVQYLVAAGDDKMIETAKRNMKWSVVGVIVGLSGWIIMQAIGNALNANPFF